MTDKLSERMRRDQSVLTGQTMGVPTATETGWIADVAALEQRVGRLADLLSKTYDNNDWCKFCGETVGGIYSHADGCELEEALAPQDEAYPNRKES